MRVMRPRKLKLTKGVPSYFLFQFLLQFRIKMEKLPWEIQEQILWHLRFDSVTLHRVEQVCTLWAQIVRFFEDYKALKFRITKTLLRLSNTQSFNENVSIKKLVNGRRCSGIVAERAEKVFLTHMEIIRLKYPGTLANLQNQGRTGSNERFGICIKAQRDIILQGVGVFMPFGDDLRGSVQVTVGVSDGQISCTKLVSSEEIRQNARMCIDHRTGMPLGHSGFFRACYPPPGQMAQQRKKKRSCMGLHPYPLFFEQSFELLSNAYLSLWVKMAYQDPVLPMETPWGGGGEEKVIGPDRTQFFFAKDSSSSCSSIQHGQIPVLYYI